MPRLATRKVQENDTRRHQIGQTREAKVAIEGPAAIEVDPIEVVDGPQFKKHADALAFNEELLKILIHPSTEQFPEDPVFVSINGRGCYITRNQPMIVKRKYVERLARAQSGSVRQNIGAKDPEDVNRLTLSSALKYPFSVLEDKNPLGAPWLAKILREG